MTVEAHLAESGIANQPAWQAKRDDILTQPNPINEIVALRLGGVKMLAIAGWVMTALLLLLSVVGGTTILFIGLLSAGLNIGPSICLFTQRSDKGSRLIVAVMAAIQPALIVLALDTIGHDHDTHLAFFFALAALSVLCDLRAICVAAAIMIVHHTLSGWGNSAGIVPDANNFGQPVIQSLRTILVAALACWIIVTFRRVLERLEQTKADNARRVELMQDQAEKLKGAMQYAAQERQQRQQCENQQATLRKNELKRIAQEFSTSISVVTEAISHAAKMLEQTTQSLTAIAQDTGENAADMSQSADLASNAANNVAQGVAQLSSSIASIANNVSQQTDLTSHATSQSVSGGEAVNGLSQHSQTIGEATRVIVQIAERTNLLSLNAAIEAANAGPAGRGFTTVAQEVKALAHQAGQAATEIDSFLKGIRSGTQEAERNFAAIDSVIGDLAKAANAIRWDVETQCKSADTIEAYARNTAKDVGAMAMRSKALANSAASSQKLSADLDKATSTMLRHVRELEQSTSQFVANLKA